MNIDHVREAYDWDERRQAYEPGARWITAGNCTAFWSPVYRAGWTLHAPPDDADAIAALRDAVEVDIRKDANQDGSPTRGELEWKCFSWDGPEPWYADGALRAAGFTPHDEEAIVIAEVDAIQHASFVSEVQGASITVRIATPTTPGRAAILADADTIHRAVWDESTQPSTVAEGYWNPAGAQAGERTAADELPHLSIHVAYLDGRPVSYGRFQVTPESRFGGLWGGATVEDARRRGCYRALVASRAGEARARGLHWLMVDANQETSYPILKRLGFELLGRTRPYGCYVGGETS